MAPVHTDKKTGRHRIQFDFAGRSYSKRLDATYSKADADKLEIKWKHDLMFESFGVDRKKAILFEDFLADYFLPFAEKHYSFEGFKNVVVICKSALKFLKGIPLRKVSVADLEAFKRFREKLPTKHDRDRKPATVNRELNIVSKIFSQAVKHDLLEYNPCSKLDRARSDDLQDAVLPFDKLQSFLDNFNSAWARDVCILILNTGLRQKDALGLKKSNVDFDKRIIRLIQGKSKRAVSIPMNAIVFELLNKRRENGSQLFFPSPKTGAQGVSIKKATAGAADRAKLGKIGTRVLRRSFATWLAEMNYNPSAIAKLLGHSGLRSITRYERETSILREAVEALEKGNLPNRPPSEDSEKG